MTLRNCFDDHDEHYKFVKTRVLRLDKDEPDISVAFDYTVLDSMWSFNGLDIERIGESVEVAFSAKNPTDPATLTIDDALKSFAKSRSLGLRRK